MSEQIFSSTTNQTKVYLIKMWAKSILGQCVDTAYQKIYVWPAPKPLFAILPNDTILQSNGLVNLQNLSTPNAPTGSNWKYVWQYGDGSRADTLLTAANVSHLYDSAVRFVITLMIITDKGCISAFSLPITVLPVLPQAAFGFGSSDTLGCAPMRVVVVNKSRFGASYRWDFGNGVVFDGKNPPAVTYYDPGKYTVRLIAQKPSGRNTAIYIRSVRIHEQPQAGFRVSPNKVIIPNRIVQTINLLRGDTTKAIFAWDFGDGSPIKYGYQPTHVYNQVGVYRVKMRFLSRYNCADSTLQDSAVIAVEGGLIVAPNAFTPRNANLPSPDNLNDTFRPLTEGAIKYMLRIYNRWGELLYESADAQIGWDGTHCGKLCTPDVYVWKAKVNFSNGDQIEKSG